MAEASIQIVGLAELQAKLQPERYQAAAGRILTKAAIQGENLGKERAPVNRGRLRASITHEVDTSSPPMWARYGTNVRYGLYLNSPITRNPHYRGGPRQGQSTRDWLTGTLPEVSRYAQGQVGAEVARIQAEW